MINAFKTLNRIFYIIFLLNILFTKQKYINLDLIATIDDDTINSLNFKDNSSIIPICNYWIPSLFNPTLLVKTDSSMEDYDYLRRIMMSCPVLSIDEEYDAYLYLLEKKNNYSLILANAAYSKSVKECYFGLSCLNNSEINENEINLNMLQEKNKIEKRIISFDKWELKENSLTSILYLGDENPNFSENGVIGSCNAYKGDFYWGCSFNEINFNNNLIKLTNQNNELYKIYFSSENHLIIFPEEFRPLFNEKTNNACNKEEEGTKFLICNNLFDSKEYITMQLINDDMIITTEIDNLNRYLNNSKPENKDTTRIKFEDIKYFIFPLIIFKEFYVQFNLENNIISFYTTNNTILKLKNKDSPKNDSSNVGKVFLIIFIILLILALGFGVFWIIKQRRASVEKNINKYNKFEDEENFQNMSEKKIY